MECSNGIANGMLKWNAQMEYANGIANGMLKWNTQMEYVNGIRKRNTYVAGRKKFFII